MQKLCDSLTCLGIELPLDHCEWLLGTGPFPEPALPQLAEAITLSEKSLLRVNSKLFPLEPAMARFKVVQALSSDLGHRLLDLELPVELDEQQLRSLFHEGRTKITVPVMIALEFLDADLALLNLEPPNAQEMTKFPYNNLSLRLARQFQLKYIEKLFLRKDCKFDPRLEPLLPPKSEKWVCAGGSVMNAILGEHKPTSDLDVFVFSDLAELLAFYDQWADKHGTTAIISHSEAVYNLIIDGVMVQLISTAATNPFDLITRFDCAAVQCFWDNGAVGTLNCLQACTDRVIRHTQEIKRSRYEKFLQRKFSFLPEPKTRESLAVALYSRPVPLKEFILPKPSLSNMYWSQKQSTCFPASQLPEDWSELLNFKDLNLGTQGISVKAAFFRGLYITFDLEPARVIATRHGIVLGNRQVSGNPVRKLETERLIQLTNAIVAQRPGIVSKFFPEVRSGALLHLKSRRYSTLLNCNGQTETKYELKEDDDQYPQLWDKLVACRVVFGGIAEYGPKKFPSSTILFDIVEMWQLE